MRRVERMTSEEFQRLRGAFDDLQSLPEAERAQALADLARRDSEMARELERLFAAQARSTSFLDRSAVASFGDASDWERPAHSRAGEQIGAYRLEEELGRGGMGVVYRAVRADGSFEKRVALKILRNDRIDNLFLNRFHQERRILAQLSHPHIASILDAGVTSDGDPWFAMDFVDGMPVTTYCATHPLTLARKLDLFLQICSAVQHAHRNLTVHCDLKPGNILVTGAGVVKLLDFGIARLIQPFPEQPQATLTVVILTPEYTSPEQIRHEPVTTAADIFALGILLYEMVSGTHPFVGHGRLPHEVMRSICDDDPPPPSSVTRQDARQIRGEVDTIALTALRKQPSWRYASVEQLADDVARYQRGWPVLARGNSLTYRLGKFVRRQWLPLTATAAVIVLLIAGIMVTTQEAQVADRARHAADQARIQAERERASADRQRHLAEQAEHLATDQRALADLRAKEAESERRKEQERYRELRTLSSSVLFDLYDGVRDLAGSTTARKLIVSKVQHQLELLNAAGTSDIGLQRDLAASYERMGELGVDPRHPDKKDAGAAVDAYQRAVELRQTIARSAGVPADRRDLALSLTRLADGEFISGDAKQAVALYQKAREQAHALAVERPADASMARALGTVDERLCIVLLTSGSAAAIDACREGIATLKPLAANSPDDVGIQRVMASIQASYANALRMAGKPQDAAAQAVLAVESLRRLETLAPSNAEYRRMSSTAESILAGSLASQGDKAASLEAFQRSIRSMEIAIEIDPSDLGSPLRLAVTLLAFSRRLAQGPEKERAHDAAQEALRLLEQTAEKPGAGPVEWNEYSNALLQVDWPDLRKPERALPLAESAVSATNRRNPFFLDTLAWAYFRTGNAPKAAATERDALSLLPANAKGGLHDELARGLSTFLGGPNP